MPATQCANLYSVSCERLDKMPELAVWVPGLTERQPSLADMSQDSSSAKK